MREIALDLLDATGSDYLLLNGQLKRLEQGQATSSSDFFSYVVISDSFDLSKRTGYSSSSKFSSDISLVFLSGRKRYFDGGYPPLKLGIGFNLDNK